MINKLICLIIGHKWMAVHRTLPDFTSRSSFCERCGKERIHHATFTFTFEKEGEDEQTE